MHIKKKNLIGIVAAATLSATSVASFIAEAGRQDRSHAVEVPVQTTTIATGSFLHPQPGEFLKDGHPVAAPRNLTDIEHSFEIMTYQVSVAEYDRCVLASVCKPADARGRGDVPVTGVSFFDATQYALWYSRKTGQSWRLPTDQEWAFAAGERFRGDMEPREEDPQNPARGWLSSYQREVDLARRPDPEPRARGSFGMNANGIADMAGNVWEWTSTCYVRTTIADDGKTAESTVENCGVHVVAGFHRTYMSNFIRDGKSGGCAIGLPPDNLGFRLVREPMHFLGLLAFGRVRG